MKTSTPFLMAAVIFTVAFALNAYLAIPINEVRTAFAGLASLICWAACAILLEMGR